MLFRQADRVYRNAASSAGSSGTFGGGEGRLRRSHQDPREATQAVPGEPRTHLKLAVANRDMAVFLQRGRPRPGGGPVLRKGVGRDGPGGRRTPRASPRSSNAPEARRMIGWSDYRGVRRRPPGTRGRGRGPAGRTSGPSNSSRRWLAIPRRVLVPDVHRPRPPRPGDDRPRAGELGGGGTAIRRGDCGFSAKFSRSRRIPIHASPWLSRWSAVQKGSRQIQAMRSRLTQPSPRQFPC